MGLNSQKLDCGARPNLHQLFACDWRVASRRHGRPLVGRRAGIYASETQWETLATNLCALRVLSGESALPMDPLTAPDKARAVAEMFGRVAPRYDLMNDVMTLGLHRHWRSLAARGAALGLHGRGLDVGAGTGDLALALARQPGITGVAAVDLVPGMVARGRAKARGRDGRLAPIAFYLADGLRLPFRDGTFVCAVSGFTLRNVADLPACFAELRRVLVEGGRTVHLELTPVGGKRLQERLFLAYFHHVVPRLGQVLAGNRAAYTYLPRSVAAFPDAEGLAELLRQSGYVNVGYRLLAGGTTAIHWGTKG